MTLPLSPLEQTPTSNLKVGLAGIGSSDLPAVGGLEKRGLGHHAREGSIVNTWVRRTVEFIGNEDGPTATEYAILLSLIIVVALVSIRALGVNLGATFHMVWNVIRRWG